MFTQSKQIENKKSYMQLLDEWLDEAVIYKLARAFEEYAAADGAGVPQEEARAKVDPVVAQVKKALREKILESYRNGQAAGGQGKFEQRKQRAYVR